MKSVILGACSLLFAWGAQAQGIGDSLIVHLKNGQRVAIPLSDIRKITFDTLGTSAVTPPPAERRGVGGGWGVVHPNPLHTSTTIDFDLPHAGDVAIQIFTESGNLLRTIAATNVAPGHNQMKWDGVDNTGAPVPAGSYFFEVRSKDFIETRKAEVVR